MKKHINLHFSFDVLAYNSKYRNITNSAAQLMSIFLKSQCGLVQFFNSRGHNVFLGEMSVSKDNLFQILSCCTVVLANT